MLNKIDIKKITAQLSVDIELCDLNLKPIDAVFAMLQYEHFKRKQIVRSYSCYYGDNNTETFYSTTAEDSFFKHQYFYDYNAFLTITKEMDWDSFRICGTLYDKDIEVVLGNQYFYITYKNNIDEAYGYLNDFVEFVCNCNLNILTENKCSPKSKRYLEFAKLLNKMDGFSNSFSYHMNAAYVIDGIPEDRVRKDKIQEWNEFRETQNDRLDKWIQLAKKKDLNELSWQIIQDIRAQAYYDLYFLKRWRADQKMLDFLLVRSENLYRQGQLTGFCILGDNDMSLVENWIFAIYSELAQLKRRA